MRALPISRTARERYQLDQVAVAAAPAAPAIPAAPAPPAIPAAQAAPARPSRLVANLPAARRVVAAVNATRRQGEPSAQAGELAAFELLHEVFHLLIARAAELQPATSMVETDGAVDDAAGQCRSDRGRPLRAQSVSAGRWSGAMITDAIVLSSIVLTGAFVVAWLVFPGLRAWIERPKHQFQDAVRRYDGAQRARHEAAEKSS